MPSQVRGRQTPDLVDMAREALNKCRGDWARLTKLTKNKLSYKWLQLFAKGEIKDPSTRKVLLLCKYIGIRVTISEGPHFLKFNPD